MMDDKDLLVAAVLIPKFKVAWLHDETKRNEVLGYMKDELMCCSVPGDDDTGEVFGSQEQRRRDQEDFFSFGSGATAQAPLPHEEELTRFLSVASDFPLDKIKESFPRVHQLFIKMNTAVPSSASVERLFSVATDAFAKKRGKMSDENFEKQLLLKVNGT